MKDMKFPFSDAPNTACFTCRHVLEENRPIRYVSHDEDGYWQFLCGGNHTEEDARVVSLLSVWEMDESVGELAGLDYGESAEAADPADGWVIAWKGKNMHQKQQDIAQNDMAQWLADPHELGKEPGRIECAAMVEKSAPTGWRRRKNSHSSKWRLLAARHAEIENRQPQNQKILRLHFLCVIFTGCPR